MLEALAENPVPVVRIGVNDEFGMSGPANALLDKFGLRGKDIAEKEKGYFIEEISVTTL